MEIIRTHNPEGFKRLDTAALRRVFLISGLFAPGKIDLRYWEVDRTIIGGAVPLAGALELTATKELLAANYFCERREVGLVNLGGAGAVEADGDSYALEKLDALYIGKGTQSVKF